MSDQTNSYRALTQSVSTQLATLRGSTPEVMKSFNELGRTATTAGVLALQGTGIRRHRSAASHARMRRSRSSWLPAIER